MRWLTDRPYLISIFILIAVALWMFLPKPEEDTAATAASARPLQKVQVRQMTADATELNLAFTGRTRPLQEARIAAEVGGQIIEIGAERGSRVTAGAVIASLDQGTLNEQLSSAKADFNVARADYQAKTKLAQQGLNSSIVQAQAGAALSAAQARVAELERTLEKLEVRAPFTGILADRRIEQGDFVDQGHVVADLLNVDTLVVEGSIPETMIGKLQLGKSASVSLIGGETREGQVRYISPVADQQTRMFTVEIEVDNVDGAMPAGMTAEVTVPLGTIAAYKLSPALLTLSAGGEILVAGVSDQDTVELYTVEIVRAESDGLWLSGIPENARVITLGQGFVHEGDPVEAIDEADASASTTN
ncbi:MAG: efflux RND transporter periplasmic adaptor subunit [Pseudomonadota bacterium]